MSNDVATAVEKSMEKAVKQKQKQKMYFPIIYFRSVVEKVCWNYCVCVIYYFEFTFHKKLAYQINLCLSLAFVSYFLLEFKNAQISILRFFKYHLNIFEEI